MSSTPRRLMLHSSRGVAAIEMSLVLVLLVLLVTGVFSFGLAMYRYDALVKSARAGVRYLSTQSPGQGYDEAKALMICGDPDNASCPDSERIPELTESMIRICDRSNTTACAGELHADVSFGVSPDDGKYDLVTVKIIGYPFTFLIPFTSLGAITFGEIRATMVQGGA